ncbi:hypothetical protein COOONC_10036 [Cooperia oncophora]
MDIETGRITRSRAKMSMGSTTPLSRPSKKVETLLRKSRNLKKQLNSSSQPSSALKSTETSSLVDLQEVSGNQRELQYMPLPAKQPTINENALTNPDVCTMSTTETSGQCASRIPLKDVSNISVVGQVPVSSSHPSLQEIHEELYNEVTAMFAPERLTFDVEVKELFPFYSFLDQIIYND